jgi:glutamate-1-semialdehyde 2,1-aminomutase
METKKSEELYSTALKYFPGGVNSPVRAFRSVEGNPLFIEKGKGCRIWDADGNEFIDFCCSWGPLILGHSNAEVLEKVAETMQHGMSFGAPTALENELAELIISNHRYIEKMRFVSSGTEATMSAIRLARGITARDKIIKFDGCYHGHADHLLVKAGSGLVTFGTSSSAGVPAGFAKETIVLPLDDEAALKEAFDTYKNEIACIIMEPVPANNGLLLQRKEYLEFIREICTANGALLIFDEVISGFRVGFEGAAGYYNIQPDIITFGKIIGGGMPVGAYASSAEMMSHIAPDGNVYQAGTLSGNPVAMSAGIAQLTQCIADGFYESQQERTLFFIHAIEQGLGGLASKIRLKTIGSIFWLSFSDDDAIRKATDIDPAGMDKFKKLYSRLLQGGVYLGPSGYEVGFVSAAHSTEDLQQAADVFVKSLQDIL